MKFKKYLIFSAFIFIVVNVCTAEAGYAKIWDTKVKETNQFYAFVDSYAWTNKANWIEVPYGTLNYKFIGDTVIENGDLWVYFHSTGVDSPFMYGNLNGKPMTVAELYGKSLLEDGSWSFNLYKNYVSIIKNTPEEIIVMEDAGKVIDKNKIYYIIKKDSKYIETRPANDYKYDMAIHSSPNRFAVAPIKNGSGIDLVIDPLNYAGIAEGEFVWFTPSNIYENMMVQEISVGGDFFSYLLIYDNHMFAEPRIGLYKGNSIMRLGTMRAYMKRGQSNERVIFGVVNNQNVFLEESPNKAISAGGTYLSIKQPTIPGRWRMSGRVRTSLGDEPYYSQDIYDQKFIFKSPISGTLEALSIYLYDRTSETPSNVKTPMDIYREVNGNNSQSIPTPIPNQIVIENPGFESGATSWTFYTNGVGTFNAVSPGYEGNNAAVLALSSVGSNMQLYQSGITLEQNTRYRLSFAGYSTTGNDVSVRFLQHVSPFTSYMPEYVANLGNTWQTFTTEFEPTGFTGAVNDARLQFWLSPFAAAGDTYYIDDIRLEKVNSSNNIYDLNNNGSIDINDLSIISDHMDETTTPPYPNYDVNTNGKIDILDLILVSSKIK